MNSKLEIGAGTERFPTVFYFQNLPGWTGVGPVNFGNIHSTRITSGPENPAEIEAE